MPQLTCFDLDDTLISELSYAHSGMDHVATWLAQAHGIDGLAPALHAALDQGVRHRVFDEVFAAHGIDPSLIPACVEQYRQHRPSLRPYPDVDAALDYAAQLGSIALITDGPAITQRRKLDALGPAFVGRFDAVVLSGELEPATHKPDPRVFQAVLERLPGPVEACCYVGDNPEKDFLWPNANGWMTVQIDRADKMYERTAPGPAHEARARVTSLEALPEHWPARGDAPA